MKALPEIIYDKSKTTPIIDARGSFYKVPYFKDSDYFGSLDSYVDFVKAVERLVRTNDRYSKYIAYLKNEIKLNRCQVLQNITDEDFSGSKPGIEMHHGPILNLFDICSIITEYFLLKKWKITTFRVADEVLNEHQRNRIQVVMLTESVHQLVHERAIFINMKQAWGDINAFINKYYVAFNPEIIDKINRYVDRSLMYDSTDFGVLRLNEKLFQHTDIETE